MGNNVTYYKIIDLNMIAKEENFIPYIYSDTQWKVDNDNILTDRLMGYDSDEIGVTDMLLRVEEISKDTAMGIINKI